MKRRWWWIFNWLAGFSLLLCGLTAWVVLPGAYAHRGRAARVSRDEIEWIFSKEYLQPSIARTEAWLTVIITALLPAAWMTLRGASVYRSVRSRTRAARGLCPACGYDTRMTPDRCPECGRESNRVSAPT